MARKETVNGGPGGTPGGVWGRAPVNGGSHFRLECPFFKEFAEFQGEIFELAVGHSGRAVFFCSFF